MGKTVSARIAGSSTSKSINQLAHNLRVKIVNYLKNSAHQNILAFGDEVVLFTQKEQEDLISQNKDMDLKKFLELLELLKKSVAEQKEIHEKAIGQKSQIKNFFIEGMLTFSPDLKQELNNNNLDKFRDLVEATLQKFEKEHGVKCLYHVIHLDEKTPHVHFTFENVNRNTGKSVQRYITKKDLADLQTFAGEIWKEMGYLRGKKNSGKKHYSVAIGHQKEELENIKKQIIEQKKIIKKQDLSAKEKKEELDKLDEVLRQTRTTIKEVKTMTEVDNKIDNDIDKLIKSSKKLFMLDEDLLRANIKKELKEYSKSDFKSLEEQNALLELQSMEKKFEELTSVSNVQENSIADLKIQNDTLIDEYNDLVDTVVDLQAETKDLKNDIQELEKDFKFNYKDWKANRKSRFDEMRESKTQRQK